jgi:hypothetical protein
VLRLVLSVDTLPGQTVETFDDLWTPRPDDLRPPVGAILLGTPPSLEPARSSPNVAWLRSHFPWLGLVITIQDPLDELSRAALAAAIAQAGAVLLADRGSSRRQIATVIQAAFVPEVTLPIWFRQALPAWQSTHRGAAVTQLLEGLSAAGMQHREDWAIGPSRRPLWVLVGRAFGAALVLQRASSNDPLDQVASLAGYHDQRTMDRALRRHFGLRAQEMRGTTGWEWLLWRFLSGLGEGPRRFWDR